MSKKDNRDLLKTLKYLAKGLAYFLLLLFLTCSFDGCIIMGGGVVPTGFYLLSQLAVCIAMSATLSFMSTSHIFPKKRIGIAKFLVIMAGIIINLGIFGGFLSIESTRIGALSDQVIQSVNDFHINKKRWPNDLSELSLNIPKSFYIEIEENSTYIRSNASGRFYVSYKLEKGLPELKRSEGRSTLCYWNWDKNIWEFYLDIQESK